MKVSLVVALLGLSISFALPTSAQQTNRPDPQIVQQVHAIDKHSDDAFLKGDAAAWAAPFKGGFAVGRPEGFELRCRVLVGDG